MLKYMLASLTVFLGLSLTAFAQETIEPSANPTNANTENTDTAPDSAAINSTNAKPEKSDTFSIKPVINPEAVANFPLDEAFLAKMAEVQKQLPSLPKEPDNPEYGNDTSITGLIAAIQYKPQLMKLLTDNGLTAQDYVTGSMALAAALAAASAEGEDQFFDDASSVSPANLDFGKKHIDEIRALLDE